MTDNVIDLKTVMCGREAKEPAMMEMIELFVTMDENGQYGVHMEVANWASDEDVAEALQAVYYKFLIDSGLFNTEE